MPVKRQKENGLENMTSGAKWKDFRLPSLKEEFFKHYAVVLLRMTPQTTMDNMLEAAQRVPSETRL